MIHIIIQYFFVLNNVFYDKFTFKMIAALRPVKEIMRPSKKKGAQLPIPGIDHNNYCKGYGFLLSGIFLPIPKLEKDF